MEEFDGRIPECCEIIDDASNGDLSIRTSTDYPSEALGRLAEEFNEMTIEEGLDALESIVEHVQETSSGVKEISSATDDQATTSEEVASIADDIAETSKENVEEAEHVASIAEEQDLALGEMYVNV